jgi:serine protease Do
MYEPINNPERKMNTKPNYGLYVLIGMTLVIIGAIIGGMLGSTLTLSRVSTLSQNSVSALQPSVESVPVSSNQVQPQKLIVSETDVETTITQDVEQIKPTVVTVVGMISGGVNFFGASSDQQVSGSGIIVTSDGYIITNNHVVEGANDLVVILSDGKQLKATLISRDVFADLAVIKVDGKMPAVARLGNSDLLKPGETVIAVGSPLGDFRNSVTVGVISATGRTIDTGNGYQLENMIQTDAAINSGNSGGPLVNLAGEVVGINTLVVRGSGSSSNAIAEGLGFAIPSNTAKTISEQIIQKGYFARPNLGVQIQDINPRIASFYDLPVQWGAYITQLDNGGPAAQAGLKKGDIITGIGKTQIDQNTSYYNALFDYAPNQEVTVEVNRSGQMLTVNVKLGEMTSSSS